MRPVTCLLALAICACLVAGCASSHEKKALQPVMIGIGGAHIAQLADVKAARASDHLYAIFPAAPGQRKCLIPWEGGVQTVKIVFRGVCRTSVRPPATVVFSERWVPCMKGAECMPGMRLRHHTWLLTMGPLTMLAGRHHYKNPAVKSSHERGDQPPQGPRP